MLLLLGSIALGVAWGWLWGLFRLPEVRPARRLAVGAGVALMATAALFLLVRMMAGNTAALAFLFASLFGFLSHSAWLESLRAQTKSSS